MALVELRGVVKRYRRGRQQVEALHNLGLDIPAGEFLALMGLSGSGKTTLLDLTGGLDRPTEGEVVIGGEHIDELSGGRPMLLVCDEPTGDLDRETTEEILGLVQLLNREQGKTVIMVTHDPKAATFAKRTLQLDKGALTDALMVAA